MINRIKNIYSMNSSRIYLAQFAQRAAEAISDGARVLDAGAGNSPYRDYFSRFRYDSTDFCQVEKQYSNISYICNLENISARSNTYDLVFCSQTLEHVPEPRIVLEEIHRVLKPSGQLWLTAPLFFPEHEIPYDFYRYTRFGLTHLLQAAGFEIKSIEWLEGYFGTFAYQLKEATKALPIKPEAYRLGLLGILIVCFIAPFKILLAVLSVFFTWLDIRTKYVTKGQCKNYAVVARKSFTSLSS
jgi:SAM-dependent methyltransferase